MDLNKWLSIFMPYLISRGLYNPSSQLQNSSHRYCFNSTSCVYPRIAPCSSLWLKNTNVRAGVLDVDYRGHVKVVIMNHSLDFALNIEAGNRIAQFILTRYKTPYISEVTKLDSTTLDSTTFGSSGL